MRVSHSSLVFFSNCSGEVFFDAKEEFSDEETTYFYNVAVENASSYGISVGFGACPAAFENDTSLLHTPPPPNVPYKRRKITRSSSYEEVDTYSEGTPKTPERTFDPFAHCEFEFVPCHAWIK